MIHEARKLTCALCRQTKKLQLSHVIPAFFLEELEDQIETGKHGQTQPHLTSFDYESGNPHYCRQKNQVLKPENFVQPLLCTDCEPRFGENYSRECLFGRTPNLKHRRAWRSHRRYRYNSQRQKVLISGYDIRRVTYQEFKRFQIGLIWRACVAAGNNFRKVSKLFNQETVEAMRCALLTGQFDEYLVPCAMELLEGGNGNNFGILQVPAPYGNKIISVMGGYRWHFFPSCEDAPKEMILKRDGEFTVLVTDVDLIYTPDYMINS